MLKQNYKVGPTNKSFVRAIIILTMAFLITAIFSIRLVSYLFFNEVKKTQ